MPELQLPPLFDDISDLELMSMSNDLHELLNQINNLRRKQLYGGGLTNEEVREGIQLLNEARIKRAGKQATEATEVSIPLEKLF